MDIITRSKNSDVVQGYIRNIDNYLKRKYVGKSDLFFVCDPTGSRFFTSRRKKITEYTFEQRIKEFEDRIDIDSKINTVEDRVLFLLFMCENYETASRSSYPQCRMGARRSANDLFRLYKHYFTDDSSIEVIDIMRALYKLVSNDSIGGQYCGNVRKMVFWYGGETVYDDDISEFGVGFEDWGNLYRKDKEYK